MRPRDILRGRRISEALVHFNEGRGGLPGIATDARRNALVEQLVESMRRVRYVTLLTEKKLSPNCGNPESIAFDPLKAAILRKRAGLVDEAFWLIFLSIHFGKHRKHNWHLTRQIYGRLGGSTHWTWGAISRDPDAFREWLRKNELALKSTNKARFGNHRKYQSLSADTSAGTGAAIVSYVRWINSYGSHERLIEAVKLETGGDPRRAFHLLYTLMETVVSFGRMAKFDYLTMIGKLGLAPIEPGSAYMEKATGPVDGARLLFGGSKSAEIVVTRLDQLIIDLESALNVGPFGMQVLEDALCNWQKSPSRFSPFRG